MAKIIPNKPLLIMLYGFPGAGKTYFARQLAESMQVVHVQSDRIRYELFDEPRYDRAENEVVGHLMDYMAEQFLLAGVSVIYDVNAMRLSQRRMLRDMARKVKSETFLVWVQIDIESAFARLAGRDRRHTDDKYAMRLDRTTFDQLTSHMQNPTNSEDYVVISGKHTFRTQQSSVLKKMHENGLIRVEDAATGLAKPGLVNLIPPLNGGRVDLARRNIIVR